MAETPLPSVLFVDQSGALGGAEHSLLDIVKSRRTAGAERDTVALLTDGPFAERLRSVGTRVELLPLGVDVQKASGFGRQLLAGPRVLKAATRLASLARRHDVVYANTQKAAVVGAVATGIARRPLIWHLRDMLDAGHFSAANRRVVVTLTNLAAKQVIANSQATADAYRRAGGSTPVRVVYNGIDPAPFEALVDDSSSPIRLSLGVEATTPLMGVFGRLTPWKGQHVLLEALCGDNLKHAHAMIVGEALFTDEDRQYAQTLRERSDEPALKGRVHWMGQRADVPALMRACDVIVHCSTQAEPFGRVIVEGMLAGRPVIAAEEGGAAEIIEHGGNGLLTPPGDANRLRAAVVELLADASLADRLATAGSQSARERFGLDDRVAEINQAISAALAGGAGG